MKSFNIEHKTFFTSKEHYRKFRQAWNDTSNQVHLNRKTHVSTLTVAHHVVFDLLRGKYSLRSFTPISNAKKIEYHNGKQYPIYDWLFDTGTLARLKNRMKMVDNYVKNPTKPRKISWFEKMVAIIAGTNTVIHKPIESHHRQAINEFLKPFNGTVTYDMLERILDISDGVK